MPTIKQIENQIAFLSKALKPLVRELSLEYIEIYGGYDYCLQVTATIYSYGTLRLVNVAVPLQEQLDLTQIKPIREQLKDKISIIRADDQSKAIYEGL